MTFFPPDVSLRVDPASDVAAAQALFPAAKQLLFRALNMKQAGAPVVKLFQPGTDGSLIYVYLIGDLKHVYVQPAALARAPQVVAAREDRALLPTDCPDMLNGVTHSSLGYHPTKVMANVYGLNYGWQTAERLGVEVDAEIGRPQPGCYSGPMMRVVQALYGIGNTKAESDGTVKEYSVVNHYDYRWSRTDGVRKVGDSFWLVRIGRVDGVLAMPLPLFECTTTASFREALQFIGDVDTFSLVDYLGGLPSGETFPSDAIDAEAAPPTSALTRAVASGDVLRLMPPSGLTEFYHDTRLDAPKNPWGESYGWAFSDSGAQDVHNICRWYKYPDVALSIPPSSEDADHRYMSSDHWKISIQLSTINKSRPVGSGSATLSLVTHGLVSMGWNLRDAVNYYKIRASPSEYVAPLFMADHKVYAFGNDGDISVNLEADRNLVAPVFVCHDKEKVEIVNWSHSRTHDLRTTRRYMVQGLTSSGTSYDQEPKFIQVDAQELEGVVGGFFSERIDLRQRERWATIWEAVSIPTKINGEFHETNENYTVHDQADIWSAELGLVLPSGCRNGYTIVRRWDRTRPLRIFQRGRPASDPIAAREGPPGFDGIGQSNTFGIPIGGGIMTVGWFSGVGVVRGPILLSNAWSIGSDSNYAYAFFWTAVGGVEIQCPVTINAGPSGGYIMANGVWPNYPAHSGYYFDVSKAIYDADGNWVRTPPLPDYTIGFGPTPGYPRDIRQSIPSSLPQDLGDSPGSITFVGAV